MITVSPVPIKLKINEQRSSILNLLKSLQILLEGKICDFSIFQGGSLVGQLVGNRVVDHRLVLLIRSSL